MSISAGKASAHILPSCHLAYNVEIHEFLPIPSTTNNFITLTTFSLATISLNLDPPLLKNSLVVQCLQFEFNPEQCAVNAQQSLFGWEGNEEQMCGDKIVVINSSLHTIYEI